MSFIVMIPAHSSSRRLPGKLLADICGIPMIIRVAKIAAQSNAKHVYIVTCDKNIQSISSEHGFSTILTESFHTTGTDRLSEAINFLELAEDATVVNLQGDEPLIEPSMVNKIAEKIADDASYKFSIVTAACPIKNKQSLLNSNVVKVIFDCNNRALYFSRSIIPWINLDSEFSFPKKNMFFRHIGIYGYRVEFLKKFPILPSSMFEQFESLEQLRALENGYEIFVHQTQLTSSFSVDTVEDLEYVRCFYKSNM